MDVHGTYVFSRKTRQAKSVTIDHYITLKNCFVIFIHWKIRRTSNLKKSAQSSGIAKLKPLSPPDVVITDDDADSVMIDGKKYFIDENDEKDSTSSISKKVVELCPEFLSGNCSEASPKYDDSENTDDKDPLSDDEAQPGTSSCLSPKAKKTSSMSSAKQSNFPQSSNKDGKTKEGQGMCYLFLYRYLVN